MIYNVQSTMQCLQPPQVNSHIPLVNKPLGTVVRRPWVTLATTPSLTVELWSSTCTPQLRKYLSPEAQKGEVR